MAVMTEEQWKQNIRTRLEFIERLLSKNGRYSLPGRLSIEGEEVTDWNTVTRTGFYWGQSTSANKPGGLSFVTGYVIVNRQTGFDRIVQRLVVPSATDGQLSAEWVRVGFAPVADVYSWTAWQRTDNVSQIGITLTGGTFNAARGRITPTAGAKEVVVAGAFSVNYSKYRIDYCLTTPPDNNSLRFVLRQGASDIGLTNMEHQDIYVTGTGTPASVQTDNGNFMKMSEPANATPGHSGYIEITNPRTQTVGQTKTCMGWDQGYGPLVDSNITQWTAFLDGEDAFGCDGFAIRLANTALAGFTVNDWIKVTAIA